MADIVKVCGPEDLAKEQSKADSHDGSTHNLLSIMGGTLDLGWGNKAWLRGDNVAVPNCGEAPLLMPDNSRIMGTKIIAPNNTQLVSLHITDQNGMPITDNPDGNIETIGPVRVDTIASNAKASASRGANGFSADGFMTEFSWKKPDGQAAVVTRPGFTYNADLTKLERREGNIQ